MDYITNVSNITKEMYDEIHDKIISDIYNFNLKTDVKNYGISTDILGNILSFIINIEQTQFYSYVSFSVGYSLTTYNETGFYISSSINYSYSSSKETFDAQQQYISNTVDNIISEIKYAPTDLDKVLYVYDYFKINNYICSSSSPNNLYNFLQTKTQHPNGYHMLLNYIFNKIGITYATVSDGSSYVCDTVKINGNWYFIDVSKDIADNTNCYILKSDNFFAEKGRNTSYSRSNGIGATWEEAISCTDTKFDWFEG